MIIKDEQVACVSDLHVGSHQNSEKWHKNVLQFAKWFRDTLKERDIKDIIICGDVNNDRDEISVHSLHVLNQLFTIWKDFNINVIVGNHDAYYKTRSDVNSLSLFSGWKNINIIDDIETLDIFGKKLSFCPWSKSPTKVPKSDYLFGHFEINGFKLSKVTTCTKGLNSDNLLKRADLIVSGHFHVRDFREYKKGRILYLGSPYELDWGDCGTEPRGFYLLDIPTGKCEFIENTISPKHKKIRMSEITSAGKITDAIKKDFKGNYVNFIVDQDIKDSNFEKLSIFIEELNKFGALSIKTDYLLEDRIGIEESEYEFTAVDIRSSIGEFIKITDIDNDNEVLTETLELYEKCRRS